MKTIKLEIELTYDEMLHHNGDENKESRAWFFRHILKGRDGELILHSNEIGDSLGDVNVLRILPDARLEPSARSNADDSRKEPNAKK
jgi:hypothetical protein